MITLDDDEVEQLILALEEGGCYDADYRIIYAARLMIEEKVKANESN